MYVSIIIIVAILGAGGNNYDITNFQNRYLGVSMSDLFKDVSMGKEWHISKYGFFNNEFLHGAGILDILSNSLLGVLPAYISWTIRGFVGLVVSIWFTNLLINNIFDPTFKISENIGGATVIVGRFFTWLFKQPVLFFTLFITFIIGFFTITNFILILLLGGTLVFLVFRIFAMLFYSYIKLLLLIIISPFLLMFEAIPGKSVFSWWIKNLISNLICFPITITIFLIGFIIVNSSTPTTYTSLNLPYLNGIDVDSSKILIGVGLVILIPELVKLTREVLGIKDLPINLGIGTFFGGAGAVFGGATGLLGQVGSFSLGLQAISGKGIHEFISGKSKKDPATNLPEADLIKTVAKNTEVLQKVLQKFQ